jgi:hypothetical protein
VESQKKREKRKMVLSFSLPIKQFVKKVMLNSNQHVFWVNFCMLVIKKKLAQLKIGQKSPHCEEKIH